MTAHDAPESRLPAPYLRRRMSGLVWLWIVAIACAIALWLLTRRFPAFAELFRPLYWLIAIVVALGTIRWFRRRRRERRSDERRAGESRRRAPFE